MLSHCRSLILFEIIIANLRKSHLDHPSEQLVDLVFTVSLISILDKVVALLFSAKGGGVGLLEVRANCEEIMDHADVTKLLLDEGVICQIVCLWD